MPFFFDDHVAITNNPTIRDLTRLDTVLAPPANGGGMTGRPIVNLSLAINYALGKTDPHGYHVFNLAIHSLAALTLFGLVRRTLLLPSLQARFAPRATSLAFFVALLWTVHPLQTESVSCVIQRTELLVSLFYLLTLYGFVRTLDAPSMRRWYVLTLVACALGMASKEVMVSAPLIVLLFDRTFGAETFRDAWRLRAKFHLGLSATWLILFALLAAMGGSRGDAAGFGLGVSPWSYALKQCDAIITYLRLSLWPHPLVIDYGTDIIADPRRVMPQALLLLALVFATFLALRRRPVVGFLAFTFFAILSPSSSVVPLITQTAAEHRMYLPLAAVVILAVFSVHRTLGNRAGLLLGLLVSAALGTSTIARNRTLQDEMALWTDTIAKAPTNPRAHASLGLALSDRGRAREAIPHFLRALELQPTSVATEQNLGNAYFQLRDFTTAAAHFRRAVALDPKFASGYNNLGATLRELGDNDAALRQYQLALSLDPQHAGAHQNAGRLFFALGRFAEAAAHYKQVQQAQPQSGKANYDLGVALAQAGDIEGAIRYFNLALQLDPSASSYFNYARFLVTAGRPRDAIDQLETALRLRPDFPEARRELDRLRGK